MCSTCLSSSARRCSLSPMSSEGHHLLSSSHLPSTPPQTLSRLLPCTQYPTLAGQKVKLHQAPISLDVRLQELILWAVTGPQPPQASHLCHYPSGDCSEKTHLCWEAAQANQNRKTSTQILHRHVTTPTTPVSLLTPFVCTMLALKTYPLPATPTQLPSCL